MTMTVGRLSGDRIVQHFGTANIIIFGGLCAATGFVLATLISCLAGDTAGLCMGRRGLLECGAGSVHRCWPTDRDARKCRRSGDQRYGLRRYPRRSGRHWLGGAHGKPLGCISDPGAYAIWGRCQQSPAAALRAYQPTSGRFSPPIPHRCAGGQLVTFVRLAHSTISAWVSPVSECWRRIAGPMAAISGERPFTTRSVRSNRHKEGTSVAATKGWEADSDPAAGRLDEAVRYPADVWQYSRSCPPQAGEVLWFDLFDQLDDTARRSDPTPATSVPVPCIEVRKGIQCLNGAVRQSKLIELDQKSAGPVG